MAGTPGAIRTVVVTDAVCWFRGCLWHATGTDPDRVDRAASAHMHGARREVEMASFPLTGRAEETVDFHACASFDKDRPALLGHACITTDRSAA